MYFKVINGSETEKKLRELKDKIDAANDLSHAIVKSLGGTKGYTNQEYLGGHISAIQFKEVPEKGQWVRRGEKYQNLYMPSAKNKAANEVLAGTAPVKNEELNNLVGWPGGLVIGEGLAIFYRPGIAFGETITIEFPKGVKHSPNPDMVEIKASEFYAIQEKEETNEN